MFLTSWYPTFKNPNFGIFIKEHAHAVYSAGNNMVVLALIIAKSNRVLDISVSDNKDETGVRTVLVQVNSRFKDFIYYLIPLQYIIAKRVYNKYIKDQFVPEIIHSNVIFPAGIIGHWLSSDLNKTHVITEHWSRIRGFMRIPFLSKLAENSYKMAGSIMPVSEFLQENILGVIPKLKREKFKVIGNVVNSDVFSYKEKLTENGIVNLCAIATWNKKKIPDKLPFLFIESLAGIQKKVTQKLKLTMIGGGDQLDELKAFCKQLQLEVEFTGFINKVEICEILHSSDFLIHASTVETFGVGIAEALMTGTPVICSKVGALPELVDDSNGVLCNNNTDEWEIGLIKAISAKYNHKEISEVVKKRFNQKVIGRQITEVYFKNI